MRRADPDESVSGGDVHDGVREEPPAVQPRLPGCGRAMLWEQQCLRCASPHTCELLT